MGVLGSLWLLLLYTQWCLKPVFDIGLAFVWIKQINAIFKNNNFDFAKLDSTPGSWPTIATAVFNIPHRQLH